MTLPKYALDYSKCTLEELEAFILARTGVPVVDYEPKNSPGHLDWIDRVGIVEARYIATLRQLDKDITFRFLDLAPEMRNLVYGELLTWPECAPAGGLGAFRESRRRPRCSPQILATSTQINHEAKDIMYAENVGHVSIIVDEEHNTKYGDNSLEVSMNHDQIFGGSFDHCLIDGFFEVPLYFHKIHHMTLSVFVEDDAWQTTTEEAANISSMTNQMLYGLSCSLAQSNNLKSLTIQLPAHKNIIDPDKIPAILWPVTKLQLHSSVVQVCGPPGIDNHYWRSQWVSIACQASKSDLRSVYESVRARLSEYTRLINKDLNRKGGFTAVAHATSNLETRESQIHELIDSHKLMSQIAEDEIRNLLSTTGVWLSEEATASLEGAIEAELSEELRAAKSTIKAIQEAVSRPRRFIE